MANMSLKKVAMPEQDPNVRNKNFEEVALGYTKEMAMEEAARCLNCKNKPCVGGCPVNVPIPAFIEKVARESLLVLDVWNVSSQTGIWQTPKKQKLILRRTE